MKTVKIHTLGCKVNIYESEAIKNEFIKNGYVITDKDCADVVVINTCTVTAVGDKKSRQIIRAAKRKNPDAVIAACGCYCQVSPKETEEVSEVDIICGTTAKLTLPTLVKEFLANKKRISIVEEQIPAVYEDMEAIIQTRTRADLKVQDGCENFCTYCIIPKARGPVRSRSIESAVSEVSKLVKNGYSEIVLVGIHLGSYGKDIGKKPIDIIKAVCGVEGVLRVRLGSIEPRLITDEFIADIKNLDNLCHSFHLSLQSGCDKTLKLMNRKYTSDEYIECVKKLKFAFSDACITTDIITGFPKETDEDFEKSYETVKKCKFAAIHVFPYSKRNGTAAASMSGQVPDDIKQKRTAKMIELGKEMKKEYFENMKNKSYEVLFEQKTKDGFFEGHTKNYIAVKVCDKGENLTGKYKNVKITDYTENFCIGETEDEN